MRVINTEKLEMIGDGAVGNVYRLSKTKIVKVYCNARNFFNKEHSDLIALNQELTACLCSKYVLPIKEAVIAKVGGKLFHGSVKEYLPYEVSELEASEIEVLLPEKLRWDVHLGNVRKDIKGKCWLIDSHLSEEKNNETLSR
jgi:hypothetical protein